MDTRRTKTPAGIPKGPDFKYQGHDGDLTGDDILEGELPPNIFPGSEEVDDMGEEGGSTEVGSRKPREEDKGGALEGVKKAIAGSVAGALGLFR